MGRSVPIPAFDAFMLPILMLCAEKQWLMRDLIKKIGDDLQLSDEERSRQIPSGGISVVASRVHWAKTYLKQAGLIQQPRRAVVEITDRGRALLLRKPPRIDLDTLREFPEFLEFARRVRTPGQTPGQSDGTTEAVFPAGAMAPTASVTPEEQIDGASSTLSALIRDALMARILESSPAFFERLIIGLLRAMGYGGSLSDPSEHVGRSGDGGIDGVIREDQLGLDRVYLQAKRYQPGNNVGGEAVRAFVGALVQRGAQKGVFITTSSFSAQAKAIPEQAGNLRLVLIDGDELTRLMVRFNVGVRIARNVEIKRIDLDFFEENELE